MHTRADSGGATMSSPKNLFYLVGLAAVFAVAARVGSSGASPAPADTPTASVFGDAFWKHWGDGRGELSGYDLTFPRYGQPRRGVAVAIFVTETFSNSLRVKADPGRHPATDEVPVMKLNLVQDFPTGIYDYNLMTSAFVALKAVNGRPAGSATKISFSSQEWCGNLYGQLLFDTGSARLTWHSYFDGEADQQKTLAVPADALAADAILLWARGLAAPALRPGERRTVPLAGSLRSSRLGHRALSVGSATLSRDAASAALTVPAGAFQVEKLRVEIAGGPSWTLWVEKAQPRRIIRWETTEGEQAALVGSDRLPYWEMQGEGQEAALKRLGLKPREPRAP